jgi:hypothetical protein
MITLKTLELARDQLRATYPDDPWEYGRRAMNLYLKAVGAGLITEGDHTDDSIQAHIDLAARALNRMNAFGPTYKEDYQQYFANYTPIKHIPNIITRISERAEELRKEAP